MNKLDREIRMLVAAGLVVGGAACNRSETPTVVARPTPITIKATPTEVESLIIPNYPTATLMPTSTVAPTESVYVPEPTKELHLPKVKMDIPVSIQLPDLQGVDVLDYEVYGSIDKVPTAPLRGQFVPEEIISEKQVKTDFVPGTGKGMVSEDRYGHQWFWVHTGYEDINKDGVWSPLQLEDLRYYVQGGTERSKLGGEFSAEQTKQLVQSLVGQSFIQVQDGVQVMLRVAGALVVDHSQMETFGSSTDNILDDAVQIDPSFAQFEGTDAQFYVCSLRVAPEQLSTLMRDGGLMYSYQRFVISVVPAWVK